MFGFAQSVTADPDKIELRLSMLIGLLSDIHGNREALEACLAHAASQGVDRYVFLGDLVGYGADPGFVINTVHEFVARGAIALLGNHDSAAIGVPERMNDEATRAIAWTRRQLGADQLDFLAGLPLKHTEDDRLYVHASAADPAEWDYVLDERSAARCLRACDAVVTFCGHVHVPALFCADAGRATGIEPEMNVAIPLKPERRCIAVIGAVGQPRDRNPAACYALYDDVARTLIYWRVAYDVETAARKIRAAGLPPFLAARLLVGR